MGETKIEPPKTTKPIQLLAAWLAGSVLLNASFLTAAGAIHEPGWLAPMMAIAAIVNVPLFFSCSISVANQIPP